MKPQSVTNYNSPFCLVYKQEDNSYISPHLLPTPSSTHYAFQQQVQHAAGRQYFILILKITLIILFFSFDFRLIFVFVLVFITYCSALPVGPNDAMMSAEQRQLGLLSRPLSTITSVISAQSNNQPRPQAIVLQRLCQQLTGGAGCNLNSILQNRLPVRL